jgi:hypothetical protein
MAEKTVQDIDNRFSVGKFSVLYSKPGGLPQGLHIDDFSKTKKEKEQFGEMLSAIVAIQDNTTIDVFACDKSRVSIMIPRGFMFLFGGHFWHGGSAYKCHNIRLHFYLKYRNHFHVHHNCVLFLLRKTSNLHCFFVNFFPISVPHSLF